jgi:hypothetical protein
VSLCLLLNVLLLNGPCYTKRFRTGRLPAAVSPPPPAPRSVLPTRQRGKGDYEKSLDNYEL